MRVVVDFDFDFVFDAGIPRGTLMEPPRPSWLVRPSDQTPYVPAGHFGVVNTMLVGRSLQGIETVSIWHGTLEPGGGAEPHIHAGSDQIYIVVAGSIEVGVGEETSLLEVMETAVIPSGQRHWLTNHGSVPAEVLVVSAPALR